MEFADLGAHCHFELCRQQTYTPFTCHLCNYKYCEFHRTAKSHECPQLKIEEQKEKDLQKQIKKTKTEKPFKCDFKGCKRTEWVSMECKDCHYNYCLLHRAYDDHKCNEIKSKNSVNNKRESFLQKLLFKSNNNNNNNNDNNNNELTKYYPNIYIDTTNADLTDICRVLSIELGYSGVDVYCPSFSDASSLLAPTELLTMHTMATTSSTNSTTTIRIANYQITLWLSIALVLTLLAAIYSLAFMSFKKDTLLYSTFNPNWEERKRR